LAAGSSRPYQCLCAGKGAGSSGRMDTAGRGEGKGSMVQEGEEEGVVCCCRGRERARQAGTGACWEGGQQLAGGRTFNHVFHCV
jgi:hypothetical protein